MRGRESVSTFGACRPNAVENVFRKLGASLPANYYGRRLASLLLGPAGGRDGAPRDVEIFETQKARLHPFDNICEKRVFLTPQFWDKAERDQLRVAIENAPKDDFYFLDVGANAGLYALFARAAAINAKKAIAIACVEPDPQMRARLAFNLHASDAEAQIRIYPYAATGRREMVKLAVNATSRGMSRIDENGGAPVQGAPLHEILLSETSFPRLDALKIDIEGGEFDALDAFFRHAPASHIPDLIILETEHDNGAKSALKICQQVGYQIQLQTRMNAVLKLGAQ